MKIDLIPNLIELYRKAATELPDDILTALNNAYSNEEGLAKETLKTIIDNINLAKNDSKPICQDTGTPFFYIKRPKDISEKEIKEQIENTTIKATNDIPLRPNAVDPISGKNIGNKPIFYFERCFT